MTAQRFTPGEVGALLAFLDPIEPLPTSNRSIATVSVHRVAAKRLADRKPAVVRLSKGVGRATLTKTGREHVDYLRHLEARAVDDEEAQAHLDTLIRRGGQL